MGMSSDLVVFLVEILRMVQEFHHAFIFLLSCVTVAIIMMIEIRILITVCPKSLYRASYCVK